jgi:hypothetical protein
MAATITQPTTASPTVTLVRPDAPEPKEAPGRRAERRPLPAEGARLVLIDNGKPKARELLAFLADELRARCAIREVEVVTKTAAGHPLEDERAAQIAPEADLVIAGLGDCGACSACSLRDAITFEKLGVPATVVITDAFVAHCARFADTLGIPGYHTLVVPHPVSSKSDEHLRRLAAGIADAAAAQLLGG